VERLERWQADLAGSQPDIWRTLIAEQDDTASECTGLSEPKIDPGI
jgi:hypothetical protein